MAAVFLGVVGPTAGRYLIDLTCGVPAKQLIRGEWFVGTAVVTSLVFYALRAPDLLDVGFAAATLISVGFGFAFRVAAVWWAWEEPMPRVPALLLACQAPRDRLKDKVKSDWQPDLGDDPA